MKKCIILNLLLLFVLTNLTANSPGIESSGNPLLKGVLPSKELLTEVAIPPVKKDLAEPIDTLGGLNEPVEQRFSFPDLDKQILASIAADLPEIMNDDMSDLTDIPVTPEEANARQILTAGELGGTKIDNFDDLLNMTLPAYRVQKIGNIEAIIVINSLKLVTGTAGDASDPPGGRLGVYVGVKIPQKTYDSEGRKKNVTLIFGTEDLQFTSQGGVQLGNIKLVNNVAFELGGSSRKSIIVLKKANIGSSGNPGTYITFGCNGVENFSLEADIHFTRNWMLPLDENGEVIETDERVVGNFQLQVQDWNNIMIGVDINNFALAKFKQVSFELGNAYIDLSDYSNPPNLGTPPGNEGLLWRGVYIETIEVGLPDPFKRKCDGGYGDGSNPDADGCRMFIGAEKLMVDKSGVSGSFYVSGEAPLASGALMNKKWNWSLDKIEVEISQSKFDRFEFEGGIVIPITKSKTAFDYTAGINFTNSSPDQPQGHQYMFNIEIAEGEVVEFPLFKAFNVSLDNNTALNVVVEDGKFKPSATLHGSMSIGKGEPSEEVTLPKIKFDNIQLKSEGQFITGGSLYLEGGGAKANNFPVQISGIGIGFGQNSVHLDFAMGIHLMKQEDGGLTASGNFEIHGKLITNVIGAHEWKFDKFVMSGFTVLIDLPAFKGCGALTLFKNDPVYGKGFSAFLDVKILGDKPSSTGTYTCGAPVESAFELSMAAVFGNLDGMRYFMVDGYVGSEKFSIPLPPTPLSLTGFGGGVQYRMKIAGYQEPGTGGQNGNAIPPGMDTSGLIYEPDPESLFGIKFAVGLTAVGPEAAGGSPINGKLSCIIRFGPGLSLQNITFWGTAELINPVGEGGIQALPDILDKVDDLALTDSERQANDLAEVQNSQDKIMAKLGISLDFESGFTFHGYAEVKISVAGGKVKGSGQLDLLMDPSGSEDYPGGRWHLFVGGYDNEEVLVPSFFNPDDNIIMYPVSVAIDYGGLQVVAKAYFLLGNDIPGPPDINAAAANFFQISTSANEENRDLLYCNGNSPANGTGVAFGASLTLKFNKKIEKKVFGVKIQILDIHINGGAGFDIALLQYGAGTACESGQSPHGLNNFRATGSIWAFIDVNGKVLGVPLPSIGIGALLQADIPNPSFFRAQVVLKFIKRWDFKFKIGDECGHPCSVVE